MTARSSRTESHWACSKCGRDVGAYKKCPHCGGTPRQVVVQEDRTISWTGLMPPKVLRAALLIEPTRGVNRPASMPARPEMGVKSKPTTKGSTNPGDVDVLILAALAKELDAVRSNSGPWSRQRNSETGFEYYLTTAYHGLTIAASGMTGMGPINAAVTTSAALTALRPKRVLLVGICAGIADDVRLGDICVSDQVVDYDLGKVGDGKGW